MKTIKAFAAIAAFAATATAFAAPASCSVDLKPGVTAVKVKPNQVIDVCLPAGDQIADIAFGNQDGWLIEGNKDAGRVMVKIRGSVGFAAETNLIVWSIKNVRYEVQLAQAHTPDVKSASK